MSRRQFGLVLSIAGLALAASASGLGNGFVFDDQPIILDNPRVHTLAGLWHSFAEPYWPPEVGAALYRPVTIVLFKLEWALGGGAPWAFHAMNVALYTAVSVAVLRLALLFLPLAAAWSTAAIFAVHPVHVEAVANTVGQPELVVGLLAVIAVAWYVRARASGALPWSTVSGLAVLYLLLCFTKEHGIVLPGLLLAAELTVVRGPPLERRRAMALGLSLVLVAAVFLSARTAVLGAFAGDIAHTAIRGVGLDQRILTMLGVVPQWLRLLALPWHLQADYMPHELDLATGFGAAQLLGLVLLVVCLALAVGARRRNPALSLGILWTGIALFPVSNLAVPTGILLAERALFLPSVGAVLAMGGLVAELLPKYSAAPLSERRVASLTLATLLGLGLWRSAERQLVWRDNDTLFRHTVLDAPLSYKAHWAYGAVLLRAGDRQHAEQEYRTALRLYQLDPNLLADFADLYLTAGQCGPAVPLYREALRLAPEHWKARSKLVLCLLDQGETDAARAEAELKTRRADPDARRIQAVVDSVAALDRANSPTAPLPFAGTE